MPDGTATLTTGAISTGQGHETMFCRLVADRLTILCDRVQFSSGDTDALLTGRGNGGSGASGVSAAAEAGAADAMIDCGRTLAAEVMEVAAADLVLEAGAFVVVGTDLRRSWGQLAAGAEEGLGSAGNLVPESVTFRTVVTCARSRSRPRLGRRGWSATSRSRIIGHVLDPVLVEGQL